MKEPENRKSAEWQRWRDLMLLEQSQQPTEDSDALPDIPVDQLSNGETEIPDTPAWRDADGTVDPMRFADSVAQRRKIEETYQYNVQHGIVEQPRKKHTQITTPEHHKPVPDQELQPFSISLIRQRMKEAKAAEEAYEEEHGPLPEEYHKGVHVQHDDGTSTIYKYSDINNSWPMRIVRFFVSRWVWGLVIGAVTAILAFFGISFFGIFGGSDDSGEEEPEQAITMYYGTVVESELDEREDGTRESLLTLDLNGEVHTVAGYGEGLHNMCEVGNYLYSDRHSDANKIQNRCTDTQDSEYDHDISVADLIR